MDKTTEESLTYHPAKVSWVTAEFIRRPPMWTARAFIYTLLLSLIVLFVYSSLAKIAIHVDARGALVTEAGILPVRVPVTIKIATLNIRENQTVKKDDVLITTQDQLSQKDYDLLQEQIAAINVVLTYRKEHECTDCSKRLARASDKALIVRSVPVLEETLAPVRELVASLVTVLTQYEQVDNLTATARRQIAINSQKLGEIKRRNAEAMLATQMEQLTTEIVAAKNQIAERKSAVETSLAQTQTRLEVRLSALQSSLEIYRSQQNIVAPISGIITHLKVSGPGQLVPAGTEVLQIIPADSQLVAELAVANKDISQIRVEMPVIIRLDALPERQYGTVNGTIETVPVSISSVMDPSAPPTYTVVVKLDRQQIKKNNVEYPFRIGMQLQGLIVTRHESMLMNGVRKLLGLSDELGG